MKSNTILRVLPLAIPVVVFLITVGCQAEPPYNSREAQTMRGKAFFQEHCVSCHGVSGRGDGEQAGELEGGAADLTRITLRRGKREQFPVVEIASIIDGRNHLQVHGEGREMPAWGQYFAEEEKLTDNEIRGKMGELIAYLMSIQEAT